MDQYKGANYKTVVMPFKAQQFMSLYIEMCPENIRKGDRHDLNRIRTKIDLSGLIASAAVVFAATSDEDNKLNPESAWESSAISPYI